MRNGNKLQGILVIGKIIAKMVSEYNFTKMEINTKACGEVISDMAKVLIGEMKEVN